MALPLNLAMTQSEIAAADQLPSRLAWMSCQFSPFTKGITNIPKSLPEGAMLILDDQQNCFTHSPDLVARQLLDAVQQLGCESVLLDFQRPADPESLAMVHAIVEALPCPVAVTEEFSKDLTCPVFLAPCPLHMPLQAYLQPWLGRELWMEAALCQEIITVTRNGTAFTPDYPVDLTGGFFEPNLLCRYRIAVSPEKITFTLFDTPETLEKKLKQAQILGISRFVGLYQELSTFL